jgi:Zinc finger domain
MEASNRGTNVCRFFLSGNCKNGDKCAFAHQQVEKPAPKREPQREQRKREVEERFEVEIKDPEVLQKLRYITDMKEQLKRICLICQRKELLAIISCGCQLMCRSCAEKEKNCPEHQTLFDKTIVIGG